MIISIKIENWMSFKDKVSFSMLASRERQHRARIPKVAKYNASILPVAVLYGGNASGKTNFFKALGFMRKFILEGSNLDSLIPVEPYKLDKTCYSKPSYFEIELLIDEIMYEYSFAVTHKHVLMEKLVRITSTSENTLFSRSNKGFIGDNPFCIEPDLREYDHLKFAARGTRENQLFLTNAVSQKIEIFKPVYDWFKDSLIMIGPETKYRNFEDLIDEEQINYTLINEMLSSLDTGISQISGDEIPFEDVSLNEVIVDLIKEKVSDKKPFKINGPSSEKWIFTKVDGEIKAKKIVTYHQNSSDMLEKFELSQESDGTKRLIDILPAFMMVTQTDSKKIVFIDELDRSLHTLLTRRLLESFLSTCNQQSRAQMLITTHDVLLMDQDIFRRDEMWVTEREPNGNSLLTSFSEYRDIRYDKDIRKSYLQGRLGGIPKLLLNDRLGCDRRSSK
jgi:hypothetical protein